MQSYRIKSGDQEKAMLLLEKGVAPEITFDGFTKAMKHQYNQYSNNERDYQYFQDTLQQPAELAIEAEMPDVFVKCIELGVNPSSYTAGNHPPDELNNNRN